MLSWAGRGIAVANAHPEVIACAVEVTGSNDEDGVACVLERLARVDFRVDPVGTLHP
jgi:hydroxymethylpyrimidine pyrophosphatase-like HAD family hydrolase